MRIELSKSQQNILPYRIQSALAFLDISLGEFTLAEVEARTGGGRDRVDQLVQMMNCPVKTGRDGHKILYQFNYPTPGNLSVCADCRMITGNDPVGCAANDAVTGGFSANKQGGYNIIPK